MNNPHPKAVSAPAALEDNRNFPQANTGAQDLDEYLFCVGGGYFYAPPGVKGADRFFADSLLLG